MLQALELFELLKREKATLSNSLIVFSAVSGISNALLLAIINAAAESVANSELNWEYLLMYVLCLGVLFFSQRYMLDRFSEIVESIVNRVRYRLVDKVRLTELVTLEKYGTSTIYARITQDTSIVSYTSTGIITNVQQGIMILFALLYIATVSLLSFALIALGIAVVLFYHLGLAETFRAMFKEASNKETEYFDKLGGILHGFKEIKINRRKNEDVFNAYAATNDANRDHRIKTSKAYNVTLIFSQILFYLILGTILFVLPKVHAEHSEVIIKVVASVIFIIGPLQNIIFYIPRIADANNSARSIMELESQLEEELKEAQKQQLDIYSPAAYQALPFESDMALKGLSYQYPSKNGSGTGFLVGPIDMAIRKGELIFVTGGNGSGKSSFLKLLTGLYKPKTGHIELDGENGRKGKVVNLRNYQQYQNLFSVIFSDYYLYDKIYGLEREIAPEEVNALLESMELSEEKTAYENGAFTNIKLSSGQRKRLALAITILEDKPIYVFDEVAADLDPEFRDKFYFEIIQELRARNKTVLVVSHDQQYWSASDRLIHFQDGMMRELSKEEVKSLVSMANRG